MFQPLSPCPFVRLKPDQTSVSISDPLCSLSPLSQRTCCSLCWNNLPPPSRSSSYSSFSSQPPRHFLWEAFRDLPGWAECLSCIPTVPCSSSMTEFTTLGWKFLHPSLSLLPVGSVWQGRCLGLCLLPPPSPHPYWHMGESQ